VSAPHTSAKILDVREAVGPVEGLRDARAERPDAIDDISGF
jgi:hypothetical protein